MPYLGNIPPTQYAELKYQDFTGGTGTSFTLNDPVGSAQELEVFVNNVRQEPGVAYTANGTALTMTGSIVATDDFYVVFQGKAIGTATHPAGQALTATEGTFTGDVGIRESSPSLGSEGTGMHITGASNKNGVLKLDSNTADYAGWLQFSENGTDQWRIAYDGANNHLEFTESGVADRMVIEDGGNVGIGLSAPNYLLQLHKSDSTNNYIQLTNSTTGSGAADGILFGIDGNEKGVIYQRANTDMVFGTNDTTRMTIESSGAIDFGSNTFGGIQEDDTNNRLILGKKAVGLKAGNSGNKLHFLSYEGTLSNGTYTIKDTVTMSENGHSGHWYLNVMQGGKGVSRVYRFTGRYNATTLTSIQGGTRGAGEDATLSFQGGTNTGGMQLVMSGFSGNCNVSVAAILCMTGTNEYFINV